MSESPIIGEVVEVEEVAERRVGKLRINAELVWVDLFPNANKRTGLGDRRQMSKQELADLTAEAGHPFPNMTAAHLFRRRKIIAQAVTEMLTPKVGVFHRQARTQSKATKPVPTWVAVLGFAAAFGAILWTMLEVGFRMKGW